MILMYVSCFTCFKNKKRTVMCGCLLCIDAILVMNDNVDREDLASDFNIESTNCFVLSYS